MASPNTATTESVRTATTESVHPVASKPIQSATAKPVCSASALIVSFTRLQPFCLTTQSAPFRKRCQLFCPRSGPFRSITALIDETAARCLQPLQPQPLGIPTGRDSRSVNHRRGSKGSKLKERSRPHSFPSHALEQQPPEPI